jgi:hypothetical protein
VIRESIVCSPACVSLALPLLPEDHTSLIISESCLLFSHSFRNSSQSMELVRNTGVRSPPLSGRVPAAVSSHSAAVQAPQRRQLVDPAEWKHAGEILRTFREIADPDPAWGMPTRESIHSEIKMGRERREVEISRAARRSPKPRHIAAEQPRYLTVEELTLRLGLRDPDDPPAKRRILTVDELTVCLGLMNGQENRRNRNPRSRTRVAE